MIPDERTQLLADRATGIGGSDIASLFSVGYGCRNRLWRDKRGMKADFPREDSGPMKLGRWLEPHIGDEYARLTGRRIETRGCIRHPEHPELLVHIDRWQTSAHRLDPGVLEIKALGRAAYCIAKREGLADDYSLQLQHGMLVAGLKWGSFAVMNRDSGDLLWWDVDRDDDICRCIEDEGPAFWATVENGPEPERLDIEDRRCQRCEYRLQCQGAALVESYGGDADLERDETMRPLIAEYAERAAIADEADGLLDETKEAIRAAMGSRGAVEAGGFRIYYRPQTSMRWDSKALAGEHARLRQHLADILRFHPELWSRKDRKFEEDYAATEAFKNASVSRPLRFYGAGKG